jgi:para-nitrobenzyl esterase
MATVRVQARNGWLGETRQLQCGIKRVPAMLGRSRKPRERARRYCLYLDIYRPQRPAYHREKLPVYVWIHGGSNNFGSARDYDGSVLAARSDVVVVVVQYPLGPIGWFYHPAIQTDGADILSDSGNFGTLAQVQALKWIHENISAFGGNPET